MGWQCHRVCFVIGFVCFKRKLIEKHQQLKMLQAYSLPLLLGYDKKFLPCNEKGFLAFQQPSDFLPPVGGGGGSHISSSAAWTSPRWHRPPAQFRPVISLDFDLMQQLRVMWFEGDKCPVQGWLALTLIPLMMREEF